MPSKTSSFNKTVFRKDLTRFAPVWVLYTICLVLGLFLLYTDYNTMRSYWFAENMTQLLPIMGVVNLIYALLVAELLFGDLYSTRMCNMLHAMPLKREGWFAAHVLAGVLFSLVPTAIMTVVATPLLMASIFENAWQIGLLVFLGSNLQYLCFFGLAVFAAMCVGNRFTMAAGYGLLNAGAYILYWLIDTVYTPMLYGIITPTTLATNLTPIVHMTNYNFLEADSLSELRKQFGDGLQGAVATFQVTEHWWRLLLWAAVGLVFLLAALRLYRKRHLECAGDAVAFRSLVPVFQVLCAIFVMTAGQVFLYSFLGLREPNYVVLAAGLVIGWFIGKMLIERSTRVFRLRNWYGLGALTAVLVVTLVCTHFDVLNIEERMPRLEKIEKIYVETGYVGGGYLEEEADFHQIMQLHEYAIENRVEKSGGYVLGTNGEWVQYIDSNSSVIDEEAVDQQQWRYVIDFSLRYELKNGNTARRRYNVWVDSEGGQILREYLNRWETITGNAQELVNGVAVSRLERAMDTFVAFAIDYVETENHPEETKTRAAAESFIAAVKADAAEGNMAQHPFFHTGIFRYYSDRYEKGYSNREGFYIYLDGKNTSWGVTVYPDSHHTVKWLQEHGLFPADFEILPEVTGYR